MRYSFHLTAPEQTPEQPQESGWHCQEEREDRGSSSRKLAMHIRLHDNQHACQSQEQERQEQHGTREAADKAVARPASIWSRQPISSGYRDQGRDEASSECRKEDCRFDEGGKKANWDSCNQRQAYALPERAELSKELGAKARLISIYWLSSIGWIVSDSLSLDRIGLVTIVSALAQGYADSR
jgi:hypothetical protein